MAWRAGKASRPATCRGRYGPRGAGDDRPGCPRRAGRRRVVDVDAAVGAPVVSIADVDMPCCTATECPACAAGEPVTPALDLN